MGKRRLAVCLLDLAKTCHYKTPRAFLGGEKKGRCASYLLMAASIIPKSLLLHLIEIVHLSTVKGGPFVPFLADVEGVLCSRKITCSWN